MNVDALADRLLLDGAVTLRRITERDLFAIAQTNTSTYLVRWRRGPKGWTCTCPNPAEHDPCPHVLAVQTVTDPERNDRDD